MLNDIAAIRNVGKSIGGYLLELAAAAALMAESLRQLMPVSDLQRGRQMCVRLRRAAQSKRQQQRRKECITLRAFGRDRSECARLWIDSQLLQGNTIAEIKSDGRTIIHRPPC